MTTPTDLVQVAVEAPLYQALTYRVSKEHLHKAQAGSRVIVPLGRRQAQGIILGPSAGLLDKDVELKEIREILEEPPLDEKNSKWLRWLAQYYLHPVGQVYGLSFAPELKISKRKSKKKPLMELEENASEKASPPKPTAEQALAISQINNSINEQKFKPFLLFGVTGSGKTEIYLQTIEHVLEKNQQALVLVPEISLTPQLIRRFVGRFGDRVAVIHSHLSEKERSEQWLSITRGEKNILVGARSALFCPMKKLGLIIVDEEHEPSYKQEEKLKYHARDAAIMKAQIFNCPIVLGSATPSLESWQNALLQKYTLLEMKSRVENRPLPQVFVTDMRLKKKNASDSHLPYWLSTEVYAALVETLKKGDQAAFFLNRRGFAQFLICPGCGYTEHCPNCSVTMTVHNHGQNMICHYCGYTDSTPNKCTSCRQESFRPMGLGTEKIFDELITLLQVDQVKVNALRLDRDEISTRQKLEDALDKINSKEVNLIVGTQMIAKGHDFPELTLVVAALADVGLNLPDFRSQERTFQLLTQVAGRAGRHQKPGQVFIQTYVPENPAIHFSTTHDFRSFAEQELKARQELFFPPFGRLAAIRIQGPQVNKVEDAAHTVKHRIQTLQKSKKLYEKIEILGPCEAALAKIKNKYRFQLLLKSPSPKELNELLQFVIQDTEWLPTNIKISADVDPINLL